MIDADHHSLYIWLGLAALILFVLLFPPLLFLWAIWEYALRHRYGPTAYPNLASQAQSACGGPGKQIIHVVRMDGLSRAL